MYRSRTCFNEAAALHRGKPQESAIEEGVSMSASMRPRHYTAGNRDHVEPLYSMAGASMRPRHYTAGNRWRCRARRPRRSCFNEAAALHRGKLRALVDDDVARFHASMRPRHYTAGNVVWRVERRHGNAHASMRPRHHTAGNLRHPRSSESTTVGFNEAAALHRGKHCQRPGPRHQQQEQAASMRPRHYTAGNPWTRLRIARDTHASPLQ